MPVSRMSHQPRPRTLAAARTRYGCPVGDVPQLSHLDSAGRARMVDVGGKCESDRRARARAVIRMSPDTAAIVARGDAPKGDVLGTARIAGIQAAKRTDELIPLAHPLPLTYIDVDAEIDPSAGTITFVGEARTTSRTGVEMEALTACTVAALTAYDMVKGIERGVAIEEVALLEKTGGKEDWRRAP
jgi:cyclic pyranopterin monophosphate synthase